MSNPPPREVSLSILLVDDDDVFRERMASAFAGRGFEVRTARDHASALAAAQADSPELAVVDLRMPGPSGLEVVKDLHAIDPATRILVLTGYGSIATAVQAMHAGATTYLPKPADVDDILAALDRAAGEPVDESGITDPKSGGPTDTPSLARVEWEHINRVLADTGGNLSETARRLGVHRRSLQRKLQKYPPRR